MVDELEEYCIAKWKEVFSTDYHVNVQPHSGTSANLASYLALLQPGDRILSMSLANGGHLSHGSPVSFSSDMYEFHFFPLEQNGRINYNLVEEYALKHNMDVSDVLRLFSKYNVLKILRSQYDVLHMMDLGESLDFVENFLGRIGA